MFSLRFQDRALLCRFTRWLPLPHSPLRPLAAAFSPLSPEATASPKPPPTSLIHSPKL